jgi:hypothetical protein
VRGVWRNFGTPGPQRVHVLDAEHNAAVFLEPSQAGREILGVLPLPAERRMHDDHPRAKLLGNLLGLDQLPPRLAAPDPLGHQQVRSVYGQHGNAVVIDQPAEHVHVLADRVGGDQYLHAVVAEAGRQFERVGHPIREDRCGGQRHQASGRHGGIAQRVSFQPRGMVQAS